MSACETQPREREAALLSNLQQSFPVCVISVRAHASSWCGRRGTSPCVWTLQQIIHACIWSS